jgi:hypothetical protein
LTTRDPPIPLPIRRRALASAPLVALTIAAALIASAMPASAEEPDPNEAYVKRKYEELWAGTDSTVKCSWAIARAVLLAIPGQDDRPLNGPERIFYENFAPVEDGVRHGVEVVPGAETPGSDEAADLLAFVYGPGFNNVYGFAYETVAWAKCMAAYYANWTGDVLSGASATNCWVYRLDTCGADNLACTMWAYTDYGTWYFIDATNWMMSPWGSVAPPVPEVPPTPCMPPDGTGCLPFCAPPDCGCPPPEAPKPEDLLE